MESKLLFNDKYIGYHTFGLKLKEILGPGKNQLLYLLLFNVRILNEDSLNLKLGSPLSILLKPDRGYTITFLGAIMKSGEDLIPIFPSFNKDLQAVELSSNKITGEILIIAIAVPDLIASNRLSLQASNTYISDNPNYEIGGLYKWAYLISVILLGMLEATDFYLLGNSLQDEYYEDDNNVGYLVKYCKDFYEGLLDSKHTIIVNKTLNTNYSKTDYNSDYVLPGYVLCRLLDLLDQIGLLEEEESLYRGAIRALKDLIKDLPRLVEPVSVEGTLGHPYLHKATYVMLHWLDGDFMIQPFKTKTAASYVNVGDPLPDTVYNDVVEQLINAAQLTYDPETQLYKHGFAGEGSSAGWNDDNGQSYFVWSRGLGWYIMTVVDVLDLLPIDHPKRDALITLYTNLMTKLLEYRDEETGVWRLLPTEDSYIEKGEEKNIFEATGSCMFAYGYLHGVAKGYLPESMKATAKKVYEDVVSYFVTVGNKGVVTLRNCVTGGNPGNNCTTREEVLQNYYSKPIANNDPHGMGPFIRASVEYESMFNNPFF